DSAVTDDSRVVAASSAISAARNRAVLAAISSIARTPGSKVSARCCADWVARNSNWTRASARIAVAAPATVKVVASLAPIEPPRSHCTAAPAVRNFPVMGLPNLYRNGFRIAVLVFHKCVQEFSRLRCCQNRYAEYQFGSHARTGAHGFRRRASLSFGAAVASS